MKESYSFTSPESGKKYTSVTPISEKAKENTLYSEKISVLEPLTHDVVLDRIMKTFLEVGSQELQTFENMLKEKGKQLVDLNKLKENSTAPFQRTNRVNDIEEFFKTKNQERRKVLIERITKLI